MALHPHAGAYAGGAGERQLASVGSVGRRRESHGNRRMRFQVPQIIVAPSRVRDAGDETGAAVVRNEGPILLQRPADHLVGGRELCNARAHRGAVPETEAGTHWRLLRPAGTGPMATRPEVAVLGILHRHPYGVRDLAAGYFVVADQARHDRQARGIGGRVSIGTERVAVQVEQRGGIGGPGGKQGVVQLVEHAG